ncbi:MAG: SUMF1/EgtB/PvdO family nonheme iron enzyme [Magnetococcales bacterium]|nr:SUMF1/EgtB/PvdO family nonheme iron enzyme [Magnetococcales bacterium]MBF0321565.1 SUMF1/EgtB/PvdO family nonheme iron enzyme [Magnetococcales bacterium]
MWAILEGQVIHEQYHLKKLLGSGGYGGVFLADEVICGHLVRRVAVKLLLLDQHHADRQLRELMASSFDHPNLVRYLTHGICHVHQDNMIFLVMDVAEERLDTLLDQGPLEPSIVLELARDLAASLAYLHGRPEQFVHRDIKPSNVLRLSGRWKLADFGLLRASGRQTLHTDNLVGTAEYSPPESYAGVITPAWDMWSLGILLAECLLGQVPLHASTPLALMQEVTNRHKPVTLPQFPAPLDMIIRGCLEKERKKRWSAVRVRETLDGRGSGKQTSPLLKSSPGIQTTPALPVLPEGDKSWHCPVTGMAFLLLPGGTFPMGSPPDQGESDERPLHQVRLSPFWLGKYPVTQGEWIRVMANNPAKFMQADRHPVEWVSWHEVQEFIQKLNLLTRESYRLPTEAEWEYACRSGGREDLRTNPADVEQMAWCASNSGGSTCPVGQKAPNGFGLYDMIGNVWEWVADWYDPSYYSRSPRDNPQGPPHGSLRVYRGGSWYDLPTGMRVSTRQAADPGERNIILGFRLARQDR